jgi:hypothetical protein
MIRKTQYKGSQNNFFTLRGSIDWGGSLQQQAQRNGAKAADKGGRTKPMHLMGRTPK